MLLRVLLTLLTPTVPVYLPKSLVSACDKQRSDEWIQLHIVDLLPLEAQQHEKIRQRFGDGRIDPSTFSQRFPNVVELVRVVRWYLDEAMEEFSVAEAIDFVAQVAALTMLNAGSNIPD